MGGGMYPTVDGKVLPEQPLDRIKSGAVSHIALITGYNREETNALRIMPAHSGRIQMSFPEFWAGMEDVLKAPQVTKLRNLYANKTYSDPMALATEILNDLVFVCPSVDAVAAQASQGGGAWHYRFSVGDDETVLEPYTGSFHGLEIPYVFGNTKGLVFLYSDTDKWAHMNGMVERIQRYWTRFAATGDPNGGDDPRWPGFGERRSRMDLSIEASVMREENQERCAFWEKNAPLAVGDRFDYIEKLIGFHPIR
jgi:para-nitrobenzyl esterase